MFIKYFKARALKKKLRISAVVIINDIEEIIQSIIDAHELKSGDDRFELLALALWLFQKMDNFEGGFKRLILDAIHEEMYDSMRRQGANFSIRKSMSDELNLRYQDYNSVYNPENGFIKVATKFISHLDSASEGRNLEHVVVPKELIDRLDVKFKEYKSVMF